MTPGDEVPPIADLYVPVSMSNAALKRLGAALAESRSLSETEEALYRAFTADAVRRYALVEAFLRQVSFDMMFNEPVVLDIRGRAKIRLTLAEKLRRDPALKLPSIQDVAGVRIVGDLRLVEQRVLAMVIAETIDKYLAVSRPSVIHDRLDHPSHGYRAIHIVSYIKARPVEIQLRTLLQHQWASYVEALGDRWGRELRYGEAIQAPTPELAAVREEVVKDLESLSTTMISRVEEAADVLWPLRASRLALDSQKWSPEVLEERMAQAREIEPTVERGRQAVVRMLESIISRAEGIGSTIQ